MLVRRRHTIRLNVFRENDFRVFVIESPIPSANARKEKKNSIKTGAAMRLGMGHEKVLSRNFIRKRAMYTYPKKYAHFACTLLFAMKIGNEQCFSSVVVPPGCLVLMKNDGNYFHFHESFFPPDC